MKHLLFLASILICFTLTSCDDKEQAPAEPANIQNLMVSSERFCSDSGGVVFSLDNSQKGVSYQLYKDDVAVEAALKGTGGAVSFPGAHKGGTYTAKSIASARYTEVVMNQSYTITGYDEPNNTTAITFAAFDPCPSAPVHSIWTLTDARDGKTYTVKLMRDGHYWMIDDLRYGGATDRCVEKVTFNGAIAGATSSDPAIYETGLFGEGTYGDCMNKKDANTPAKRGYLYDWMAVMQNPEGYHKSTYIGCQEKNGSAFQGLCPEGWHVPTGNNTGELFALNTAENGGSTTNSAGMLAPAPFSAVYSGYCKTGGSLLGQGGNVSYWSSTCNPNVATRTAFVFLMTPLYCFAGYNAESDRNQGRTLRCLRNYE